MLEPGEALIPNPNVVLKCELGNIDDKTCFTLENYDSVPQHPNWMKVCYGDLWFWLRKPREERLSIVESAAASAAAECDKQPPHWFRRRLSTQGPNSIKKI